MFNIERYRNGISEFQNEIERLINKHSKENTSDTPDWILAKYLNGCLKLYDNTTKLRNQYYNGNLTENVDLKVTLE